MRCRPWHHPFCVTKSIFVVFRPKRCSPHQHPHSRLRAGTEAPEPARVRAIQSQGEEGGQSFHSQSFHSQDYHGNSEEG